MFSRCFKTGVSVAEPSSLQGAVELAVVVVALGIVVVTVDTGFL